MEIDERKRAILEAIIRDYVKTAEPVGSRAIVKKHNLGVSSATVRNEMADLEEMGYLEQPHTSAGRIPSETGFRYYVDYMMVKDEVTEEEEEFLRNILDRKVDDMSNLIQRTGQVLAQLTNYASVTVTPPSNKAEFRNMQMAMVGKDRAMIMLLTDVGTVIHRRIELPTGIRAEDLQVVSELFNATFQGKQLGDVSHTMLRSLRNELLHRRRIIERALEALEGAMSEDEDEKVYISGTLNILNQPEFKDFEKLKKVLVALEEHDFIKNLLQETGLKEVRIKIGNENESEEIKELSLVFTSMESEGKDMGRIGLIGPVRMEYWKASSSVEKVRDIIQDIISGIIK
ncbi:MAG: heat-inducible transcriptional repressor HrcA [Chitinophagales bacterium]